MDKLEEELKLAQAGLLDPALLEIPPLPPAELPVIKGVKYGCHTACEAKIMNIIQEWIRLHQKNDWTIHFEEIECEFMLVDERPVLVPYQSLTLKPPMRHADRPEFPAHRTICFPYATLLDMEVGELKMTRFALAEAKLLDIPPPVPRDLPIIHGDALEYGSQTPCPTQTLYIIQGWIQFHQKNEWTIHFKAIESTKGLLYQSLILAPPRRYAKHPGFPIHRIICFPYATLI